MTRAVNAAARALIERNEGCVLQAYRDIVGVLTIGYGHTANVYPGQRITQAEADAMLDRDLTAEFAPAVEAALAGHPCTDNQFGALVSLAYNVGVGGEAHSTVQRLHNAGDYHGAAQAFLMWDKAGGRVVPALLRRRQEEAELYVMPDSAVLTPPGAIIPDPVLPDTAAIPAPQPAVTDADAVAAVMALQRTLVALKRYRGAVDGILGPQTAAAAMAAYSANPGVKFP